MVDEQKNAPYSTYREVFSFDAATSIDPDGDSLIFNWWIYQEAGTYPGHIMISNSNKDKPKLTIPTGAANKQIHLILDVKDNNSIASLFDYRRIVIDVKDMVVNQESIQVF